MSICGDDMASLDAALQRIAELERDLATEVANRHTAARVQCEEANKLLNAMGGDPAYSLLDNAKRLAARPEVGALAWTEANHREESLARAIHALPGTEWTFWLEHEGVMYAHRHVLPPFVPSPQKEIK